MVSRIVEEAQREGTPLFKLERKVKDVIGAVRSLVRLAELTQAIEQEVEKCPEARRLRREGWRKANESGIGPYGKHLWHDGRFL